MSRQVEILVAKEIDFCHMIAHLLVFLT